MFSSCVHCITLFSGKQSGATSRPLALYIDSRCSSLFLACLLLAFLFGSGCRRDRSTASPGKRHGDVETLLSAVDSACALNNTNDLHRLMSEATALSTEELRQGLESASQLSPRHQLMLVGVLSRNPRSESLVRNALHAPIDETRLLAASSLLELTSRRHESPDPVVASTLQDLLASSSSWIRARAAWSLAVLDVRSPMIVTELINALARAEGGEGEQDAFGRELRDAYLHCLIDIADVDYSSATNTPGGSASAEYRQWLAQHRALIRAPVETSDAALRRYRDPLHGFALSVPLSYVRVQVPRADTRDRCFFSSQDGGFIKVATGPKRGDLAEEFAIVRQYQSVHEIERGVIDESPYVLYGIQASEGRCLELLCVGKMRLYAVRAYTPSSTEIDAALRKLILRFHLL